MVELSTNNPKPTTYNLEPRTQFIIQSGAIGLVPPKTHNSQPLNRYRSFDMWMRIVIDQFEVLIFEIKNILHIRVDLHGW